MGKVRRDHVAELVGLLGKPRRLCCAGDRRPSCAAVDIGPSFEREALGEPRQSAVRPVSVYRVPKERKREVVRPYGHRGPTNGHRLIGTGHAYWRQLLDSTDDLRPSMDWIDERERRQTLGM